MRRGRARPRRSGSKGLLGVLAILAAALGVIDWRDIDWRELIGIPGEPLAGFARAIDGDSLRIGGAEIRLKGVDAPELAQTCARSGGSYRCGEDAREALAGLVRGRTVTCQGSGSDRYGRALARCSVEGEDLGRTLVAQGLAVAYGDYEAEELRARRDRRGLWAGTFQRPEEWRADNPRS